MKPEEISFATRDEYQRKPIAENVINLLSSEAYVSPMVIDGGWGTGKTEFCYKLINLIENGESNLKAVYVDAFKADHADEPLMTLLAAILKLLPEADRPTLIKNALPAVRFGIKTTFKAGVSWLLKQDAADIADDFDGDLKKAGDQAINHAVESLLEDHVTSEESIDTLKNALLEISNESPIVIFIDELDRCRPDFAVSMMESIKHVFDVDSVQFVLVTNSGQLRASINHCYGEEVDSQRYLDKFIGFSFSLPDTFKPNGNNAALVSVHHLESLIRKSESLREFFRAKDAVLSFLKSQIEVDRLSLREIETLIRHLEIYQALTENEGLSTNTIIGYALLRVFGVYLFCFNSVLAEQIASGFVDAPAIANFLGKTRLLELENNRPDYADFIVAVVSFETSIIKDEFTFESDQIREVWEEQVMAFFRGHGGFPPDIGEITSIISGSVDSLRLGN